MKHRRRSKYARHIPAIVGIALLGAGFIAVQYSAKSDADASELELAASGDRATDGAASRGGTREEVSSIAQQIATAAQSPQLVSPAEELDPTTTTTAAPTTTTSTTEPPVITVPPTPVSTAPPATAPTTPPAPKPAAATSGNSESGKASYYAHKAGGCAHKTLPKGTTVTVTNVNNGKTATCVVNDRGPFIAGRIIDLDVTVFKQIATTSQGVAPVRISW